MKTLDDHPERSNVCNRVSNGWTTHDVGGLFANDVALARIVDQASAADAASLAPRAQPLSPGNGATPCSGN